MKKQISPGTIADQLLNRNDRQADFWREYFKADQAGTVTRAMRHQGEQLLKMQDNSVKRFLSEIRK